MNKQSNPYPQPSDFPLLNVSQSQVLAAVDSLSNPSEPPDIRNWFSSYTYESPELNSDFQRYGFGGSAGVEEGFNGEKNTKGKEENFGEFRKIRSKDGLDLGEKAASIGFVKSNNTSEDQDHGNKNASQVMVSSDSLSLLSEPPEITRWFSSYVYESPAVDASDAFKDSVSTASECEKVACNAENCCNEKEESSTETISAERDLLVADKNMSSNGLVKCMSSGTENSRFHGYNCKDTYSVEGNKMISGQALEGKPTENHNVGSTQDGEKSSLAGQVSIEKTGGNKGKSLKKMTCQTMDSIEIRKPTSGIKDKENDGSIFQEHGFISTRNERRERLNYDTTLKRSMEFKFDCLGNGVTDSSSLVLRRKPFSETTNNIQHTTSEIIGKWQCPQKSKPNLGPPLKQLRLEQWVHRGALAISIAKRAIDDGLKEDMTSTFIGRRLPRSTWTTFHRNGSLNLAVIKKQQTSHMRNDCTSTCYTDRRFPYKAS